MTGRVGAGACRTNWLTRLLSLLPPEKNGSVGARSDVLGQGQPRRLSPDIGHELSVV